MNDSREQSSSLSDIYEQRKDSFLDSLQNILKSIGSDLFIKQMLDDKSSEVYVPDRICEIIQNNLNSDREKYINQLEKRLRAFEACFGKERVKKFEEIGYNILDHSEKMKRMKNFNLNDKENQTYIRMINDEFKQFNNDTNIRLDLRYTKKDVQQLKDKVHSTNEFITSNSHFFKDLQNQLIKSIRNYCQEAKLAVKDFTINNNKKIDLIKTESEKKANLISSEKSEIERKFSNSENQVNFLKEQINQKDDLIKSLKENQAKTNEQFQLTLQQINQRDKEISNLQHSLSVKPDVDNTNSMKQKIATLEADLKYSKSKLFEASQIQGEKTAITESLRLLQNENSSLRNKITEKDLELHSYQRQIKEMKDTFIKLKESMPERKQIMEKLTHLQEKNRQLKLTIEGQKSKIEDLQALKKQLKQKVDLLNDNLNEKNELIQKIRGNISDTLQNESDKKLTISQLKDKIKEYDSALKLLSKKVKQKQSQCSSLTKENKEIRSEIVEIKEELKRTKDELESTFDNLQSLKEESKSKDSIIDDFKNSLKKSSMTIRDLSSANLKINEQSLIIKSNEETNSQLLNEVSKQEEKIKELSEKLIDCDKKLKKQIQINFAQSKQNETLAALNSKQEIEINEAHSKMIDMHSRLLKFEEDKQNHSDSIKNLTNDNNREVTERKLIESYINKERERYHNEVDNLQKKISQLVVEKTDLEHKLDQFKFENSTIKQLLQAREKEMNIEKQKNAEDVRKMREMMSKVLDENDRLRRENKKLNPKPNLIQNEYSNQDENLSFERGGINNSFSNGFGNKQSRNNNANSNEMLNRSSGQNQNKNDYHNANNLYNQNNNGNFNASKSNDKNDNDSFNTNNLHSQNNNGNNYFNENRSNNQNNNSNFNGNNLHSQSNNGNNYFNENRSNNQSNNDNFNGNNSYDQYRSDNFNGNNSNDQNNSELFNRRSNQRKNNSFNGNKSNRTNNNDFDIQNDTDYYNRSKPNDPSINNYASSSNMQDNNDDFNFNNSTNNDFFNPNNSSNKRQSDYLNRNNSSIGRQNDHLSRDSINDQNRSSFLSGNDFNNQSRDELFNGSGFNPQRNDNYFSNQSRNGMNNINDETVSQLKQIRQILNCEDDQNAIEKVAQIKDENSELKEVHAKLRELCGTDDIVSSVSQMKKQNSFYQEQNKSLEKILPEQDQTFSIGNDRNSNSVVNKVMDMKDKMKKVQSMLHCNDASEIPEAIQQLNNDNISLRKSLESIQKVVPNNNSSSEDLVSAITDAFKENKFIKSQLFGSSPNSPSSQNSPYAFRSRKTRTKADDSNTKIERMKDESANFQMIKKSLSKGDVANDDITRKVIEMGENERKLQEILHSDDVISSVQSIQKENEKYKNNEKTLSKMLNQSSLSQSPFSDFSESNKSTNEKVADLIHQNSELKKTHNAIQNLLPASTQVNLRSSSGVGSRHHDNFTQNLKNYQERVTNIIDENKQLKHEKETVEELLRPFQKNDRYTNETKSPYTIREILQENEKLKKIQKSLGTIVGSKEEEEIESKVKELFETKKKIESILPQEELDLPTRVSNLMNENESLKDSLDSISRIIPKKNRRKTQSGINSPTNKFNSESELFENNNNSFSFSDFNRNDETIEDVVQNYVEQNESLNKKIRKIKSMIPGHFDDLEEGIESILKENRKLKQDQINARHAIPSFLAKKIKQKNMNLNENDPEFEEEEEEVSIESNLIVDFPHLIEELVKEIELFKQERDEVSGILPGNRTDDIVDRLNRLINERNSLEDNENEIKEILADFAYDEDEDVISIVKNLSNKVRQIERIIPFRSPNKQLASSCPNSPPNSPIHLFSFHSDSGSPDKKKSFDFVSSVKRLVNDNSRLEEIQREADQLISENFPQNPNQSLIEKINSLLSSNAIFKAQQERISNLIFGENSNSNNSVMSIENKIIELLTENQELKQTESELNKLIPPDKYKKATIQENVRDILNENKQNESIKEKVRNMLNDVMTPNSPLANDLSNGSIENDNSEIDENLKSDFDDDEKTVKSDVCFSPTGKLERKVQSLISKKKKVENEVMQIEKILPQNDENANKSLHERVQALADENQKLKAEKDKLNKLFNNDVNHSKSEDDNLVSNVQNALATIDQLKNVLPVQNKSSLPEAFQSIVAENEALHKQKSELEKLLTSPDSSVPSDLSAKLQSVLEENMDLRKRLKRVVALFPGTMENAFDDIVMQIRLLIDNNAEMKQLRTEISRLLRLDDTSNLKLMSKLDKLQKENMLQEIKNLVDQCQLLKSDKETLDKCKKILANENEGENDDDIEKVDDDHFLTISVVDEIQRILRNLNEFQSFSNDLFDLLRCESLAEARQEIEDNQKNLSCLMEIAQRLFDAISGPSNSSPVRLAFPIYEKRKLSLFNLIDSFRKRLSESQKTVETVIEKARKLGFNGGTLELPTAVQYLEEMAALAERQKLDENFRQEVEELRELNNKQQKMADQKCEKFKKKIQDKVAFANEMQEKLNQKELKFIEDVEAERKKVRQYGILAEKQKRIITELIRVISGKGADLEFLKSNLNVNEAVALQYAEAIHDTVLKIQNDSHHFL